MGRHKWKSFMGFFDKAEGVGSTNFGEHQIVNKPVTSSLDSFLPINPTVAINGKYEDDLANTTFSIPNYQPSHVTFASDIESVQVNLLNDDEKDLEVTADLDVERVIKQQNTHDLHCPYCNSCITRRVILRKRKRGFRVTDEEVNRNGFETVVEPVLVTGMGWSPGGHFDDTCATMQTVDSAPLQPSTGGEERKEYKIEVIKSIVYGGLAETITSLCVVSSAAAGGASTLNILALGMANLIGGLFIICRSLWKLRIDHVEQVNTQTSEQVTDQYKELLGRRQNFVLHAIVAILSYLVFGLMPPVVYGFSFRKTDDKLLKLLVVVASSLLCLAILAIGQAYARRPPKRYFISVVGVVVLGFMVSGVSYAVGELVERLLEKLGVFQTSSVSGLILDELNLTGNGSS